MKFLRTQKFPEPKVMNTLPNEVRALFAPYLTKREIGELKVVNKAARGIYTPEVIKRNRNTKNRLRSLQNAALRMGRNATPRRYNLLHSSIYKALLNYERLRANLTNQKKRELAAMRGFIYNMPRNNRGFQYGTWWVSAVHQNPNTGRHNTVNINNNGNMTVMAYNPATRRYNIAG